MTAVGTAPIRGKRELRKQVTRRDLLAAGRRLFSEKGLYDSSIEDLTRVAGVAKGTLYGYFADKEALVEAVVASGFDEMAGQSLRRAHDAETRPDRIAAVTRAHLEFFEANPDLLRVFQQVRGLLKFDRPHWVGLLRVLERHLAIIAALVSHDGRNATERDMAMAKVLFGAVSGISSVRVTIRPQDPVTIELDVTVAAITSAVLAFVTPPRGRARA
jgi:AcrR family transcriptional regulator